MPKQLRTTPPFISVIIPIYNEAEGLSIFIRSLISVISHCLYEIIIINDGSTDDTATHCERLQAQYSHIHVIHLSRNFGKEAALTAGLSYCKGNIAIPMDADGQDPPALIPEMIDAWKLGYDQVIAVRRTRKHDTFLKKYTAKKFYQYFNKLSDCKIPENAGDYRVLDRKVIDALLTLKEQNRFMKGLFSWVGFKTTFIYFDRSNRQHGQSSWNALKLCRFAIDGITAFSSIPLRLWGYIGALISFLSGSFMLYTIIKTLLLGIDVPGYASLLTIILFMGGIQLLSLGIIGEYISRIYQETKQRPLYIIDEIIQGKTVRDPLADKIIHMQ